MGSTQHSNPQSTNALAQMNSKQNFQNLCFLTMLIMLWLMSSVLALATNDSFQRSQVGPVGLLKDPWEILYAPNGKLWITERSTGEVSEVHPVNGAKKTLLRIDDVHPFSGQAGLLGMDHHPNLGKGMDQDWIYLTYTYLSGGIPFQRITRYRYENESGLGRFVEPIVLIEGLPSSNDHISGRLKIGHDKKIYLTIGDMGANQFGNKCKPIESQRLPTAEELQQQDWSAYKGKILRIDLNGSIPTDNPSISGLRSHVFSFGHRNAQGLVFSRDGLLFSSEHGPKSDDEVNRIEAGRNYGWPHVAGRQDDQAYTYCNWSLHSRCEILKFSDYYCPKTIQTNLESEWYHSDFQEPLETLFTVSNDHIFRQPACGHEFICWPTVATSSLDLYESEAIPNWWPSLLVVSLKHGQIYRLKLNTTQSEAKEPPKPFFRTQNRYRDIAIHPDGKTFFIITDNRGLASSLSGGSTQELDHPGTILRFNYRNE